MPIGQKKLDKVFDSEHLKTFDSVIGCFVRKWGVFFTGIIVFTVSAIMLYQPLRPMQKPIRIGVLHSLTGTMAISEAPIVDAVRLAVEEINAQGGLLGRPVEMQVADGRSDWQVFAEQAQQLIVRDHVSALFGCWTSACRKALKPIVEEHNHIMFYPVQYEGLETSPNIVYTGSAPNQQIVPGTHWALERFGRRIYLIGSDYIFPRAANIIIRDLVNAAGGEILGERYVSMGATDMAAIIDDIARQQPDVVLNTLNGDSNRAFFGALQQAGLRDIPVLSFSVAETEMRVWGGCELTRHFAVWSYFQSLARPENRRFVQAFQSRFGHDRAISDPMEAAYVGVKLWAQAVQDARSEAPHRVNQTIRRQSFNGPSEIASIDSATRHLWKMVRIGQVHPDGQFEQVFSSSQPLRPYPWPLYRSREEWLLLLGTVPAEAGH